MKIAIVNDTHTGVRNGSDVFLDNAELFYSRVFFPYLLESGITRIIHLGDYYDHRKFVNFKVLTRDRKMFLDKLEEYGITMDIIPGNHDVYWKNSNELSSLKECLSKFSSHVRLHMKPVVLPGTPIALVPWISPENEKVCMDFIGANPAPILMGHFDILGFQMLKGGAASTHGLDKEVFNKFEMVLSGHYHTKSTMGNITYLGTQFETTWSDCGDPKYFHIFDTETRELTPVRNPYILFHKVFYDDRNFAQKQNWLDQFDFSSMKSAMVKIVVVSKGNPLLFDKFVDKIYKENPFELKIVESLNEFTSGQVDDTVVSLEDTTSLLNSYIDGIDTDLDKTKLKTQLERLYVQAQALEIV